MSNRTMLVENIAGKIGASKKDADAILLDVIESIREQLASEGEAVLPGFGRLKLETRAARKGHNPKTGAPIDIPSKQVVKFKLFPAS